MVWKIYKSILVILKADVLKLQFFFKLFFFCILYLFILFIYLFIYLFKYVYYFCYTHFVNTNLKLLLSINCECVWICNTCDAINFHFSYTKEHGYTHSRVGQHVAYRVEMQHVVVARYNADHFRVEQRDSASCFLFKRLLTKLQFSSNLWKNRES